MLLRGSFRRVSYRPRPRTPAEERSLDAPAHRFFGEQLARLRDDGADVSAGPPDAARARTDDGRTDGGAEAGQEEEESGETQGEEEGREASAESKGEERREEAEEGGEEAPPVTHLDVPPRERRSDGPSHLLKALPRYVCGLPRIERQCDACSALDLVRGNGGVRRLRRSTGGVRKSAGGNRGD